MKNACSDPKNFYVKKPPGHVGVKRSCFKCCHGWVLGDSSESKSLPHLLQMSDFLPQYGSNVLNLMTDMDLESEELSAFEFI